MIAISLLVQDLPVININISSIFVCYCDVYNRFDYFFVFSLTKSRFIAYIRYSKVEFIKEILNFLSPAVVISTAPNTRMCI